MKAIEGLALLLIALAVTACSADGGVASPDAPPQRVNTPSPTLPSAVSTAATTLRTFPLRRNGDCDAMAIDNPVTGRLMGDPKDQREPVWLERDDGTRLSVVWPAGFTVQFEPELALHDEQGRVVARNGDQVTLDQVPVTEASGTYEDPYYAAGILFDGCYPRAG